MHLATGSPVHADVPRHRQRQKQGASVLVPTALHLFFKLDFADTSALSDVDAFERRRQNGRNAKLSKKDRARERKEIERSWDTPVNGNSVATSNVVVAVGSPGPHPVWSRPSSSQAPSAHNAVVSNGSAAAWSLPQSGAPKANRTNTASAPEKTPYASGRRPLLSPRQGTRRVGLAEGEGGDASVEGGCTLRCWDVVGVAVGVTWLLELWLHQSYGILSDAGAWKWVTHIEGGSEVAVTRARKAANTHVGLARAFVAVEPLRGVATMGVVCAGKSELMGTVNWL
jgi:hypothetical protein